MRLDGVRVLVVDDEADTRDLIGRALEDRGARISMAGNSQDAIEILERNEIDVLLADIAMPDEDGCSLIRRIRSGASPLASIPAAAVTARQGGRTHARWRQGFTPHGQTGRAGRDRSHGESPGARPEGQPAITRVGRGRARCMMSEPSSGSVRFCPNRLFIHQVVVPDNFPQMERAQRRQFLSEQIGILVVPGKRVQNRVAPLSPRALRGSS